MYVYQSIPQLLKQIARSSLALGREMKTQKLLKTCSNCVVIGQFKSVVIGQFKSVAIGQFESVAIGQFESVAIGQLKRATSK